MYQKPSVARFGAFRALTQAGCSNTTDNMTFQGSGPSVGSTPRTSGNIVEYCFVTAGSR